MDVEELLRRELREVADGMHIPQLPPLPREQPRPHRRRLPLLVAAAVAVIVGAGAAFLTTNGPSHHPQPAGQLPSNPPPTHTQPTQPPEPTRTVPRVPTTPPTVPYVVDGRLYVDGKRVPGTWWSVDYGDASWLAMRRDGTWWTGDSTQPQSIEALVDVPPVISPNGKYVGDIVTPNGQPLISGFETRPGGEGLGGIPVDLGDPGAGDPVRVRAVTDDGKVIAQGHGTSLMWLPFKARDNTVDLSSTAPGQEILANTPAGLVVTEGDGGTPYLAKISDSGELSRIASLPSADVVASPDATWLAWPGTPTEGDVTAIDTLEVQAVDGTRHGSWTAPSGWQFAVRSWSWEDDTHLVVRVVGKNGERMARCQVGNPGCVLISTP